MTTPKRLARCLIEQMMTTTPKRPPGRPPVPDDQRMIVNSIRLTAAQWAKLDRLGGAAWLRERIDKAKATP